MLIGLTGGISSGKSTVSNMIKSLSIPVIDADLIAREVVEPGQETFKKIVEHFGTDIVENGQIDRKKLGAIVFQFEKERLALNQIIHPAIRKRLEQQIKEYQKKGHITVILDIPLLFESKLTYMVEKIILVYVDEQTQIQRLMNRDGFNYEEAQARIKSQLPLHEKIPLADEVINNSGSLEDTEKQLINILKKWNCL